MDRRIEMQGMDSDPMTDTKSPVEKITKELTSEASERRYGELMEVALFVCFSSLLIASFTSETLRDSTLWDLEGWRWSILAFVLLAGWILAKWAVGLIVRIVGLIARFVAHIRDKKKTAHVRDQEKTAYLILGLKPSLTGFIWVGFVLVGWLMLIVFRVGRSEPRPDKEARKDFSFVTRTIVGVLVGFAIWMVKTLSLEYLALYFIVERCREKIEETTQEQKLLRGICEEIGEEIGHKRSVLNDEHEAITKDRYWTPKFVVDLVTETDLPIHVEEDDIKEDGEDISFERVARLTGDKLFDKIAEKCAGGTAAPKPKFIRKSQEQKKLMRMLEEAIEPVRPLSKNVGDERFRRSDFRKWVVRVYRHRLDLMRTLNGSDEVLGGLNRVVSTIQLVLMLIVWLVITELLSGKLLTVLLAQILAFSFMFSESAKTGFETILFVFATQPFDVGDRIQTGPDTQEMVVHNMNLLSTSFKLVDGEHVIYPNSELMKKNIINFYYVPDSSDSVEFNISIDTPKTTIKQLRSKVEGYWKQQSKNWNHQKCRFVVEEEAGPSDLKTKSIILNVYHTVSFYNGGDRTKRRNELTTEVTKYIKELQIILNDQEKA